MIKAGKSIRQILQYNEQKVSRGEAHLILASGFAADIDHLDFNRKLKRFQYLTELRPGVRYRALHISLNFDVSETLEDRKMQKIANRYMELLDYGDQPFLVYRHTDVAHPHMHITTVTIRPDGKPITVYKTIKYWWRDIRQVIEREFDLLDAETKKKYVLPSPKLEEIEPVSYGQISTKRAISQVVHAVLNHYRFTSLSEFNAALQPYNVLADRGPENSLMYKNRGLLYFVLDEAGNRKGKPLKASSFYYKPTLMHIESKFKQNQTLRDPFRQDLKNRLDDILLPYQTQREDTFRKALSKSGIYVSFSGNKQEVMYVDKLHHTVFSGSALGKAYTKKGLGKRIGQSDLPRDYFLPASLDLKQSMGQNIEDISSDKETPKKHLREETPDAYLQTRRKSKSLNKL